MVPVGRLGRATHHAKTSAHHGNRHPDVACAGRADHRPAAGGFITSYADWRWIFFINVPLGIIAILLALRIIPDLHEDTRRPFDLPGFVVTTLAMVSLGLCDGVDGRRASADRINRHAVYRRYCRVKPGAASL